MLIFYYKYLILIIILLFHKIFKINNCNEIIPNIYIGNAWSSILNYKDFDVIVNVTKDIEFPEKFEKTKIRIPVDDLYIFKNQDIKNYLNYIDGLQELYNQNKKILIHCRCGIQRSGFITQLLLMKILNINQEQTINLIQNKSSLKFVSNNFILNNLHNVNKNFKKYLL